WHFGGQATWEPASTRADKDDVRYPGDGALYAPESKDREWVSTQSIYAGGPLIEDRLFFFGSYELERREGTDVKNVEATNSYSRYEYERPRWYAKVDWNITDNHLLELTGASSRNVYRGDIFAYD
ncbi:Oar protein, partial [Mycobacterium tuberculosis]